VSDYDDLIQMSAAEIRAALEYQCCPLCGQGPWKSPAAHVSLAHGVHADVLREVAGFNRTHQLIDDALHESMSVRAHGNGTIDHLGEKRWGKGSAQGLHWTRRAEAQDARRAIQTTPDARARFAALMGKVDRSEVNRKTFSRPERRAFSREVFMKAREKWTPEERAEYARRGALSRTAKYAADPEARATWLAKKWRTPTRDRLQPLLPEIQRRRVAGETLKTLAAAYSTDRNTLSATLRDFTEETTDE
jgi:hypothetical protein